MRQSCSFADRREARGQRRPLYFLREWASDPLRVAAVAPSSPALARLITSEIDASTAPVIELGPGTGVFTRALIANGVRERDLALIELGERFAADLRQAFPTAKTLNTSAAALANRAIFGERAAGAIISGLGLLSMPKHVVAAILSGVERNLRPGASFYQFTYGWRCPVQDALLEQLDLSAERIGVVCANLPPAAVYKISRRADARRAALERARAAWSTNDNSRNLTSGFFFRLLTLIEPPPEGEG